VKGCSLAEPEASKGGLAGDLEPVGGDSGSDGGSAFSKPKPNKHWAQNPPGLSVGMTVPHSLHLSPKAMAVPFTTGIPRKPYRKFSSRAEHRDEMAYLFLDLAF